MKKIVLGIVAVLFIIGTQSVLAKRTTRLDDCGGTIIKYKTTLGACRSGKYPGRTVVRCSSKGKTKKRRRCSTDKRRRGVYLDTCTGKPVPYKTLRKACKSGRYDGKFLVRCRYGREKQRMQCEKASRKDRRIVLFVNGCGSKKRLKGINLRRACRKNPGKKISKCIRRGNFWKERKAMYCSGGSRRDRVKFRKCSPREQNIIISDMKVAERKVDRLIRELRRKLKDGTKMSKSVRRKMKIVLRKLKKIAKAFDRRRTYVCKPNKTLCQKANAHTLFFGSKVKICESYYTRTDQLERAATIVHEISHYKTQTNDKGSYRGCAASAKPKASEPFQRRASYYGQITHCGLYIPK